MKDNNKLNNRLDNLQWLSSGDNYRKNNSGDNHWTRRLGLSKEHIEKFSGSRWSSKNDKRPHTDGNNV